MSSMGTQSTTHHDLNRICYSILKFDCFKHIRISAVKKPIVREMPKLRMSFSTEDTSTRNYRRCMCRIYFINTIPHETIAMTTSLFCPKEFSVLLQNYRSWINGYAYMQKSFFFYLSDSCGVHHAYVLGRKSNEKMNWNILKMQVCYLMFYYSYLPIQHTRTHHNCICKARFVGDITTSKLYTSAGLP